MKSQASLKVKSRKFVKPQQESGIRQTAAKRIRLATRLPSSDLITTCGGRETERRGVANRKHPGFHASAHGVVKQ